MNRTVKRLAAVAALGATMGVVAPVASASAATPFALPGAGLPGFSPGAGFDPVGLGGLGGYGGFDGAGYGPAAVVGPVIITSGVGVSFINTNNQVTAGSAFSGGQVTAP